jgi:hypothetical protein
MGRAGTVDVERHHVEHDTRRVLVRDRARHEVALLDHAVAFAEQGRELVRVVRGADREQQVEELTPDPPALHALIDTAVEVIRTPGRQRA